MEAVARVERCRENGAMDNKRSPQRRPASTERFSRSSYGRSRQTEPGRRPSVQGESAPTPRRVSRADYERTRCLLYTSQRAMRHEPDHHQGGHHHALLQQPPVLDLRVLVQLHDAGLVLSLIHIYS